MSSTFAVGGLVSGLDTTSIIAQLMSLEERPLTLLKAKQSSHSSKMAAIQSIKDMIASLQSAAKGLTDRSKTNAKSAVTDTPSTSPAVLTASATADAINGSFKVNVKQLATSTRVASSGPLGSAIDKNATLASAGFRYTLTTGTFQINGKSIAVDNDTTLDGATGSLIDAINGTAGIGLTASLVADADGRPENRVQLISDAGKPIQLGSLSDSSNALRLLNLSDAVISGYTASSVTGNAVSGGALSTSITVNGTEIAIEQANGGFTAAQNAAFIADAINDSAAGATVQATADAGTGTVSLTHKVAGAAQKIEITGAGAATGLTDGTIQNGTDRVVSSTNLGVTDVGAALTSARLVTPMAGYTAANVTGEAASAGALSTSITINGVTTAIEQADGGFSAVQNAQFIAQAINDNADNTVTASADAITGEITLTHKTTGGQQKIEITDAGTGTGLANGTTQNGTGGSGRFKINGVEIAYKDTDSLSTVVNRINASAAGVSAFYDPVQDRVRLTASQTGARSMTLEDTQGNFLAATGVLNASQEYGKNAIFNIDEVNGGADLTSNTNSVSGYLPGVTLTLKSVSTSPVTVTVAQDAQTTTNTVKGFVTQFNNVLQKIEDLTKYDATTKRASVLTGDSGIRDLQRQLRQMVSSAAIGTSGAYRDLSSIGVSFGAVGSAAGTTNRLVIDDAKLSKAIADSPQAVETLLASFSATLGTPTGSVITAASGTPQIHQDGTYHVKITNETTGAYEAKFVTTGGQTTWTSTGTMTAGADSFGVIPGLKITPGAFTNGAESTFTVSVTNRGIGVMLNDYLTTLTDRDGYFADRKAGDDRITKDFTDRLTVMEARLERRKVSLEKKYAALEVAMAKMQSQGNALSAQLMKLNAAPQ